MRRWLLTLLATAFVSSTAVAGAIVKISIDKYARLHRQDVQCLAYALDKVLSQEEEQSIVTYVSSSARANTVRKIYAVARDTLKEAGRKEELCRVAGLSGDYVGGPDWNVLLNYAAVIIDHS